MKLKLRKAIHKQIQKYISHATKKQQRRVLIKLLSKDAKMPTKGTKGAAGFDLYAAANVKIEPRSRAFVSTGISLEFPFNDVYARIAPRSGLSVKGFDIGAGVVDKDYRGEVKVLMINNSTDTCHFQQGERIAQLIFEKIADVQLLETDVLTDTERGKGGFGSTGKF